MHYGQEAAHGACIHDSRGRNSASSQKGKLECSIQLSQIENYYFLNNKKSALSGPLNEVKHGSLNVAKLGQHSASGLPICYQPHENKLKHTSQTIVCTINNNQKSMTSEMGIWIILWCLTPFRCLHLKEKKSQKVLGNFSVFAWHFAMTIDLAIYLHPAISLSIGFFFRFNRLWLFMSSAHIYSILLCKHPLLKLIRGKELVRHLLMV